MRELFSLLIFVTLFVIKVVVIIVMTIYYLLRELIFGITIPIRDEGFDPIISGEVPSEPTDAEMDRQMNRYEKNQWAKYLKALETEASNEDPF